MYERDNVETVLLFHTEGGRKVEKKTAVMQTIRDLGEGCERTQRSIEGELDMKE